MKSAIQYIVSVVVASVLLVFILSNKGCFHTTQKLVETDTVYVDKPYKVIEIKEVEKPVRMEVYKRDTVLREKLEKDTLITGIEIKRKEIRIHRLTPEGIGLVNGYDIDGVDEMVVDSNGKLELGRKKRNRKVLRNLERVGILVTACYLTSLFIKNGNS